MNQGREIRSLILNSVGKWTEAMKALAAHSTQSSPKVYLHYYT